MIKFFRKTRQNLLNEGKTSKYFKYAIGEIVLVVIGILIALQINNWNEGRKHVESENEFIEGIYNDLTQDKKYIEVVLSVLKPKIKAYNLLNEKNSEIFVEDKNHIDSLLNMYLFKGQRTFYPISGTYQSAIAGNEINTYKNKEVTRSIIKLYNSTYPRLIDNSEILDDRWNHLSEKYSHERRTNHFDKMDKTQFSNVLDDMHYHYIQLNWYITILENTTIEINELQNKFDD
jgi:hypothetical protein